jgi:hypothetical protein
MSENFVAFVCFVVRKFFVGWNWFSNPLLVEDGQ